MFRLRNNSGFTIVELLIVIVVIAILATITVVAYNGIRNRAYDAAVKSDLSTLRKKIDIYNIEIGKYPTPNSVDLTKVDFKASKGSYAINPKTTHNLDYCVDNLGNVTDYVVIALSKSGNKFYISKDSGVADLSGAWNPSDPRQCKTVLPTYTNNLRGYAAEDLSTGPWRDWVGGN